jgi:hypothetical protein
MPNPNPIRAAAPAVTHPKKLRLVPEGEELEAAIVPCSMFISSKYQLVDSYEKLAFPPFLASDTSSVRQ